MIVGVDMVTGKVWTPRVSLGVCVSVLAGWLAAGEQKGCIVCGG